jgi:hypothetical protein
MSAYGSACLVERQSAELSPIPSARASLRERREWSVRRTFAGVRTDACSCYKCGMEVDVSWRWNSRLSASRTLKSAGREPVVGGVTLAGRLCDQGPPRTGLPAHGAAPTRCDARGTAPRVPRAASDRAAVHGLLRRVPALACDSERDHAGRSLQVAGGSANPNSDLADLPASPPPCESRRVSPRAHQHESIRGAQPAGDNRWLRWGRSGEAGPRTTP